MFEVCLEIHNDGKEKRYSFEARYGDSILNGYGANEKEAKTELKKNLNKLVEQIRNIDWDNPIYVACDGIPIKK